MLLYLGVGSREVAWGGTGGKELVRARPLAPGDTQWWGGPLLAGRPTAWRWDRQPVDGIDADTRSLWLLTHFSSSSHTGPADTEGELQPAVGQVSQEGDKREPRRPFQVPSPGRGP